MPVLTRKMDDQVWEFCDCKQLCGMGGVWNQQSKQIQLVDITWHYMTFHDISIIFHSFPTIQTLQLPEVDRVAAMAMSAFVSFGEESRRNLAPALRNLRSIFCVFWISLRFEAIHGNSLRIPFQQCSTLEAPSKALKSCLADSRVDLVQHSFLVQNVGIF